ncbi:MAG: hypothetical protein ACD_65C00230G0006 [uncultured bacterium]|nr:MAG: hypothetical protein ACD_65C00230G0006 [uncultured bacterium]
MNKEKLVRSIIPLIIIVLLLGSALLPLFTANITQ